jgi:membrane-bound lytic murein transglycosylase D
VLLTPLLVLMAVVGCANGGHSVNPESFDSASDGAAFDSSAHFAIPVDSDSLIAEALEACESAEALWQQGDIDGSLATLDTAYELLLQIPDDPNLIQQKEDLRHLISLRVVDIYRSQLTTAVDLNSPIPLEINDHVQREIARFTGP